MCQKQHFQNKKLLITYFYKIKYGFSGLVIFFSFLHVISAFDPIKNKNLDMTISVIFYLILKLFIRQTKIEILVVLNTRLDLKYLWYKTRS
jgi:hypothetical protein